MDRRKVLAAMCVGFVLLSGCADKTAPDGSGSGVPGSSASQSQALRPGDEGFTFDYKLPEDWEPETFPDNNSQAMRDYLVETDQARFADGQGRTTMPVGDFYLGIDWGLPYAMLPSEDFWEKNPEMPQELYELPVNMMAKSNDFRVIGGREFNELNGDLAPYYVEAAKHVFQTVYNMSREELDQMVDDRLYYSFPSGTKEDTRLYNEMELYKTLPGWVRSDCAFLTDESLCYLASDGTIRVKGMILYKEEYQTEEGTVFDYGKVISDIMLGVIPEEVKDKPWAWDFGDFYYEFHADTMRPELLTEEAYEALMEQYHLTTEKLERPEWMGVYGGN